MTTVLKPQNPAEETLIISPKMLSTFPEEFQNLARRMESRGKVKITDDSTGKV